MHAATVLVETCLLPLLRSSRHLGWSCLCYVRVVSAVFCNYPAKVLIPGHARRLTRHTASKGQQAAAKLDALLNAAATASEYDAAIALNRHGPHCVVSSRHLHEREASGAIALAQSVRHYWAVVPIDQHPTPTRNLRLAKPRVLAPSVSSLRDQFSCLLAVCICNDWLAGYSHSTFPPSLPASLVSSCRAAPPHHLYTTEATSTDRTTHTASDNSFSSHLSLYQSIPEYFRQHMEPPELPQVSHHPPANPVNAEPLNTAGMPSTYRTLRSASAGRKPEKANSLLDEFATEELQTLSKLLPAPAAAAVAHTQPEDARSASPGSPHSASTVGSQPTGSEHLSPESVPRTHSRAVSKRSSSASNSSCLLQPYVCKAGTAYANRNPCAHAWCDMYVYV